jgi:hypothetical protein
MVRGLRALFDVGATPFSARPSQLTYRRWWAFSPTFITHAITNPFHFFSEETPTNLEAWLTKLQDYTIRESSGSHLNRPLANYNKEQKSR